MSVIRINNYEKEILWIFIELNLFKLFLCTYIFLITAIYFFQFRFLLFIYTY